MHNREDMISIRKQELRGIRHEVKNYLTGVKGAAEIIKMQDEGATSDPMWEILDRSMGNLIDFLEKSKEIDSLWDAVRVKTHLNEVIDDIKNVKGVEAIDANVPCDNRELMVDKASLRKAFDIIVENMKLRCNKLHVIIDAKDEAHIKFVGDVSFLDSDFLSANKTFYAKEGGGVGLSISCAKAIILLNDGRFEMANEGDFGVVYVII